MGTGSPRPRLGASQSRALRKLEADPNAAAGGEASARQPQARQARGQPVVAGPLLAVDGSRTATGRTTACASELLTAVSNASTLPARSSVASLL